MGGPFYVGDWLVEPHLNQVTRGAAVVRLRPRVMDLLVCLARDAGAVLSKQALLDRVWGAEFLSESALTTAIAELRHSLDDNGEPRRIVDTVPKRGYRLVAPVRWASVQADASTSSLVGGTAVSPEEPPPFDLQVQQEQSARMAAPDVPSGRRVPMMTAAAAALALAVLGSISGPFQTGGTPAVRSIAVLPFDDLSGDPGRAYYAEGMTEALITELSAVDQFDKVVGRHSVVQFRNVARPLTEVARELHVDALVTGSAMSAGGRLLVMVRLVDGRTERPLWAGHFEEAEGEILVLQRQIVAEIARELRIALKPGTRTQGAQLPMIEPAAWEAYVAATRAFSAFSPESRRLALQHIETAVSLAPTFAQAHATMAAFYAEMALTGDISQAEAFSRGKTAALKSLNLDPTLAEAHSANGRLLLLADWDWQGAERAHLRAIDLKRNDAAIRGAYGHYLTLSGRYEEALGEMRRGTNLDPASLLATGLLAWACLHARSYEESIEQWEKALTLAPEAHAAGRGILARAYAGSRREADALALCGDGRSTDMSCAATYAMLGRETAARAIADGLPEDSVSLPRIELHALLGDSRQVVQLLERAYAARNTAVLFLNGPAFDRVRADPGFQSLRRRVAYPGS